jgi:hypothetical protein
LPYTTIGVRCADDDFSSSEENELADLHSLLPALSALSISHPDSGMGSMFPYFQDLTPFLNSKVFTALRELSLGLQSVPDLNLMLEHAARSRLERLTCQVEDRGKPVNVDLLARRVEVPRDVEGVEVPRGFELLVGGPSKTGKAIQRTQTSLDLILALQRAEESDLAWRLQYKQPMTKQMQALVEALKAGECTPGTIDAWKAAHEKPATRAGKRRTKAKH